MKFIQKKRIILSKKGFNMISLIVAIGIIGIIAVGVVIYSNPQKRIGQANDARRWEDVIAIAKAVEIYSLDNKQIPSDFSTSTLSIGQKFVLCNTESSLSCDGQTNGCLVVDDTDFLSFLPGLPIDPLKSDQADTGYYVTRTSADALAVGACNTYDSTLSIEYIAKASLPPVSSDCGDGFVDSDEVCDDSNTVNEGCGNGSTETAGSYCNSSCSATITISVSEICDDGNLVTETCGDGVLHSNIGYCNNDCSATYAGNEDCDYDVWSDDCFNRSWLTEVDVGSGSYCNDNCRNVECALPPMP